MTDSAIRGIKAFGAYIPRLRLQRASVAAAHAWGFPALRGLGKGERSMCAWDEDSITMAVEAGRDCLKAGSARELEGLTLASTTAPYADINNAVFVSAALGLCDEAGADDAGGSTRAALSALTRACRASGSGTQMVIGSENRRTKPASVQEMRYGDGAAAVTVGSGDDVIARFVGSETVSVPFIDHFRKAGHDFDYGWEERWVRDEGINKIIPAAVSRLLGRVDKTTSEVSAFGMAGGPPKADAGLARKLNIAPERVIDGLASNVGDTGTAHPMLLLVSALEKAGPGDLIVIVSFAQGCEVVAFEMLSAAPTTGRKAVSGAVAQRIEETAYLKMLSNQGQLDLDWGMRAETDHKTALTQLYRSSDQIFGFTGGKCGSCGTTQFPRLPNCVNCGEADTQAPYSLADEAATVATYTADWLQYSPSPPLYMGLVQFQSGARVLMEIVDVGSEGLDVGTPLSMTFRKKERDKLRGWDRYFWKATPAL